MTTPPLPGGDDPEDVLESDLHRLTIALGSHGLLICGFAFTPLFPQMSSSARLFVLEKLSVLYFGLCHFLWACFVIVHRDVSNEVDGRRRTQGLFLSYTLEVGQNREKQSRKSSEHFHSSGLQAAILTDLAQMFHCCRGELSLQFCLFVFERKSTCCFLPQGWGLLPCHC